MSRSQEPLAGPKAIGRDVEELVVDAVAGLRPAADPEDWYDAVVKTCLDPRSAERVSFGSIALVSPETRVEIKACSRSVSNGSRGDRAGRWLLQRDQHDRLLDDGSVYLLAVYQEVSASKQLDDMLVVPVSIVDEIVADSWYDVDRHEGQVAQLPWPEVVGRDGGDQA